MVGIHFVSPWYDPSQLTGRKTSSIYKYLLSRMYPTYHQLAQFGGNHPQIKDKKFDHFFSTWNNCLYVRFPPVKDKSAEILRILLLLWSCFNKNFHILTLCMFWSLHNKRLLRFRRKRIFPMHKLIKHPHPSKRVLNKTQWISDLLASRQCS